MPEQDPTGLGALRKATGISRGRSRVQQTLGDILMGGVDVLTGALGIPTGIDSKGVTIGELLTAGVPLVGGVKAAQAAKRVANPIKAYHGSPHDFDQFSLSKIGTGEGAQAYGHGLYFAESPEVAKSYKLAGPEADNQFNRINARMSEIAKQLEAIEIPGSYRKYRDPVAGEKLAAEYDALMDSKNKVGKTYEVNIHADPEDFLDWDAPLSQQSEKVQRLANERWRMNNEVRPDAPGSVIHRKLGAIGPNSMTARMPPGEQTAEGILKAQGIPGIKYLDGASRSAGQGSRNYVVFDDSLIDILKKYGLAGLAGSSIGQLLGMSGQPQGGQ